MLIRRVSPRQATCTLVAATLVLLVGCSGSIYAPEQVGPTNAGESTGHIRVVADCEVICDACAIRHAVDEYVRPCLLDSEWGLPRHDEVCERYGIVLLRWGLPFGVEEDHTFIYEGDVSVAEFMDFKGEISWVDGETQ